MGKKNNFVIAVNGTEAMLCEEDDPRLETSNYTIIFGKYVLGPKDGYKKTHYKGWFIGEDGSKYMVDTSRKAYQVV